MKRITAFLLLCISVSPVSLLQATPDAGGCTEHEVIGVRGGTFMVRITKDIQPGSHFFHSIETWYQIRNKKTNTVLKEELHEAVDYAHDIESRSTDTVHRNVGKVTINPATGKPLTARREEGFFATVDNRLFYVLIKDDERLHYFLADRAISGSGRSGVGAV